MAARLQHSDLAQPKHEKGTGTLCVGHLHISGATEREPHSQDFSVPALENLGIYVEFLQFLHGKCTIYMKEADEFSVLESSSVDGDLLHCVRCKNSTMNE